MYVIELVGGELPAGSRLVCVDRLRPFVSIPRVVPRSYWADEPLVGPQIDEYRVERVTVSRGDSAFLVYAGVLAGVSDGAALAEIERRLEGLFGSTL